MHVAVDSRRIVLFERDDLGSRCEDTFGGRGSWEGGLRRGGLSRHRGRCIVRGLPGQ